MSAIALIPARGGSKRIPRKNIRSFAGKPMLAWIIQSAQESGCFESIIVSTDDEEIAEIAKEYGAEVPFMRPAELVDDFATNVAVMQHAANLLDKKTDYICCIYPTAALTTPQDLQRGLELMRGSQSAAFSVTRYAHPIDRALRMGEGSLMTMLNPDQANSRSQDLEEKWHDTGQFYWATPDIWLAGDTFLTINAAGIEIPRHRAVDIDTEEDWQLAEQIFIAQRNKA